MLVSWNAPYNGGLAITNYKIFVKTFDGTFKEEKVYCSVSITSC